MAEKRVLLVEDNRDNRTIYRAILEHAGYRVLEAQDGAQGVREARAQHPDLILMDLSMPVMDGWEATQQLKADEATREIPICAISAHILWTDEDVARVEAAGFECYLTKPIEPREVLQAVRERIGAPGAGKEPRQQRPVLLRGLAGA